MASKFPKDIEARNAAARASLPRRFWSKVRKAGPNDCWEWTGSLSREGYGQIYDGFSPKGWNSLTNSHRVSYELHNGPIPGGLVIDHVCRNRKCVNPAHLRAVPPRVNGTENNLSPIAANARRTRCSNGHPFTPENLAMVPLKNRKTRHGNPAKDAVCRVCLTCRPWSWRYAIIPRPRPPGSRVLKTDPDFKPHRGGTPK